MLYHPMRNRRGFPASASLVLLLALSLPASAVDYTFKKVINAPFPVNEIRDVSISNNGTIAFTARLGADLHSLFTKKSGVITIILDGAGPFVLSGAPAISDNSIVAFWANFDDSHGLFTAAPDGTVTPITLGPSDIVFPRRPVVNDSGTVAFYDYPLIVAGNGGPLNTIADAANPGPASLSDPSMNNHGIVAFSYHNFDTDYDAIYTADGGPLTLIVDDTGPYTAVYNPLINDHNHIAFFANNAAGERIIVSFDGTTFTTLANVESLDDFYRPTFNDKGTLAFKAKLDTGDEGIFITGPQLGIQKVIQVGDPLFGSTLVSLFSYFDTSGSGVFGGFGGINDYGDIAFFYQLADGRTGIAVALVPEPASLFTLAASGLALRRRHKC